MWVFDMILEPCFHILLAMAIYVHRWTASDFILVLFWIHTWDKKKSQKESKIVKSQISKNVVRSNFSFFVTESMTWFQRTFTCNFKAGVDFLFELRIFDFFVYANFLIKFALNAKNYKNRHRFLDVWKYDFKYLTAPFILVRRSRRFI